MNIIGKITNSNGTFDICTVYHLGEIWIATYDAVADELDYLVIVDNDDDIIELANKLFKGQPTYEIYS